jgi:protein TonB
MDPVSRDPVSRGSQRRYVAVAALGLIALAAVLTRDRWAATFKPAPARPSLQVEVKSEGNGLLSVRWNPASAAVAQAREGRLIIVEANQQPRVVPLQAEQLKSGHVYYQSTAERLEFELEVVTNSGSTLKESVLALSSGKAPEVPAAASPAPAQQAEASKPSKAEQVEPKREPQATADRVEPPQTTERPAARVFTPPPTTMAARPTVEDTRAVILDPSTAPTSAVAPARLNLPPALSSLPTAPLKAPSGPAATARPPVGGSVQPALLVRKVAPVYPVFARSSRIEGVVKFSATIDKQGRVQNLQLLGGPQLLVKAASDAVKQWVYRPMLLDGKPMEVITQIEVRFALKE